MILSMVLPKQLESLAECKLWVCYPLIPNPKKHGGLTGDTGYDKPPFSPIPTKNGKLMYASTKNPESWGTYKEAVSCLGKTVKAANHEGIWGDYELKRVGLINPGGLVMIDLDGVINPCNADKGGVRTITPEANEIVKKLNSYTEISASGKGLHILCIAGLPEDMSSKKAYGKRDAFGTDQAEYEIICNSEATEISEEKIVYFGLSLDVVGDRGLNERTTELAEVYEKYFRKPKPVPVYKPDALSSSGSSGNGASSVVSSGGVLREQWLNFVKRSGDADILEGIFQSPFGSQIRALYNGSYNYVVEGEKNKGQPDHSRADFALLLYLYGFTSDRDLTLRLFKQSKLYRAHGKSADYLERTMTKVENGNPMLYVGHILSFTKEEKKAWAEKKEQEELAQIEQLRSKLKECTSESESLDIIRKIDALKKRTRYRR